MKKKTWVYLGVALLVLVPLAAQQGNLLQPRSSVTVYDSKGKTVGTLIDASFLLSGYSPVGIPTVAFKAGQQTVFVGVRADHFVGNNGGVLLFGTADCSGTPYFMYPPPIGPSPISQSFVKNDGTLYAAPGNSNSSTTVYISSAFFQELNAPGPDSCGPYEAGDTQVIEAQPIGNFTGMYQPPFVLK